MVLFENMSEVVTVNEKDEVIGKMDRELAHNNGTPHRIVVVYVENDNAQILVQVRMTGRLDHSSAGHVDPGEEYVGAAYRELNEELGINHVELAYVGGGVSEEVVPDLEEHRVHIMQIYSCRGNPGKLQKEEVRDIYWANPKEVLKEMLDNLNDMKFSGEFRTSLPIYVATKTQKLSLK